MRRIGSRLRGSWRFATPGAAVAAAIEQMMQDEEEREIALSALADEIHNRLQTSRSGFVGKGLALSAARATTYSVSRSVNYRIRFHPLVSRDLDAIARLAIDKSGRLPWNQVSRGFLYGGEVVRFASQSWEIFQPRRMSAAVFVKTIEPWRGRPRYYRNQHFRCVWRTGVLECKEVGE